MLWLCNFQTEKQNVDAAITLQTYLFLTLFDIEISQMEIWSQFAFKPQNPQCLMDK